MALNRVIVLALFGVFIHEAVGQLFGLGFQRPGMMNPFEPPPVVYSTCIGKNTNGDEVRITFSDQAPSGRQRDRNPWWNPAPIRRGLWLNAFLRLGQSSTTQGTFQLLLTTYGRVGDGCVGQALGDIIDNGGNLMNFFQQRRRQRQETGRLGGAFMLNSMQRIYNTDVELDDFTNFREVNGRGIAVCPVYGISGRRCSTPMPLCCTVGRDSVNATTIIQPVTMGMNNMGMGMGMNNMGMNNMAMGGAGTMGMGNNPGMPAMGGAAPAMGGLPGGGAPATGGLPQGNPLGANLFATK